MVILGGWVFLMSEVPLYGRRGHIRSSLPFQIRFTVAPPLSPEDRTLNTDEFMNTDEFIPHKAGSPFGWIEPEIAQYPKST